jgi:hypothetical protein
VSWGKSAALSWVRPASAACRGLPLFCLVAVLGTAFSWPCERARAEDVLQKLRDDVRAASSGAGDAGNQGSHRPSAYDPANPECDGGQSFFEATAGLILGGLSSPFWVPPAALGDDYTAFASFPRFPYDGVPGYLGTSCVPPRPRAWAGRLSVEYLETFDDLDVIGGRLLVSTASRFGLDTQMDYFRETLRNGRHDQLWTGDCNLVFRFAQCDFAEFRAGLGFNWLSDPVRDDFGFNFTYGADVFPRRPWVISADLDWGTLGRAELFRFRTTIGVTVQRFEFYTGYEYTDIDRMHLNSLIGGVRVWF